MVFVAITILCFFYFEVLRQLQAQQQYNYKSIHSDHILSCSFYTEQCKLDNIICLKSIICYHALSQCKSSFRKYFAACQMINDRHYKATQPFVYNLYSRVEDSCFLRIRMSRIFLQGRRACQIKTMQHLNSVILCLQRWLEEVLQQFSAALVVQYSITKVCSCTIFIKNVDDTDSYQI
ncbi:Hypothetical_protein [Hexamita inflata]|uniref:Hypothetical_protein n=1 Tax=Hexamita inflata TaxID=28002 RepID=A0AA86UXY5_9EUKA|nr:Hypothetical protein HINF_LOCUS64048 [Hexamita inflata]CAI9976405.1 Hypothetical protein HINF_LOCUS64050 [Hexamita inflata]